MERTTSISLKEGGEGGGGLAKGISSMSKQRLPQFTTRKLSKIGYITNNQPEN